MEAVIHVILSHGFAIGAFVLIVLCEYIGYKRNSPEWEAFARNYIRFTVIVVTAVGAVTGVGIWFYISTLAPRATGSMLRIFFWPWWIEWFFFAGELIVLIAYYYLWDKWTGERKMRHIWLGASYTLLAFWTAFLITGIISFMLTSDGWPWSGSFRQAFFNPSFVPHLLLRLTGALALGGLISLCYLFAIRAKPDFRKEASRLFGVVLIAGTIATVIFVWWYFKVVPSAFKSHAIAAVLPRELPKDPALFWAANIVGLAIILALGLTAVKRRTTLARALIIPSAIVGFAFVAEFEYVREFIRGPYLMPGYMYANQVLVKESLFFNKAGAGSPRSGQYLFGRNCSSCHTITGINSIKDRVSGRPEDGIRVILKHTHDLVPWMPPFSGTDQERRVLARYLFQLSNGEVKARESARISDLSERSDMADLLLRRPLNNEWTLSLLFITFTLHMVFVLFTIGTGILGVYYYIHRGARRLGWDKQVLHTFLAHKSLTVVLGVGPLLLIQTGFTIPFFMAINLMSPLWLVNIMLLIAAFLALDVFGQFERMPCPRQMALGLLGLMALLAVPAIFVAVLTITENPDKWLTIIRHDHRLPAELTVHWLFRYLHILGAGVVFAGTFHHLVSRDARKRESLLRWITGGMLWQVLIGVMLFTTTRPDRIANTTLFIGVAIAVVLMWMVAIRRSIDTRVVPSLLAGLLIFMLLTRQIHQNQGIVPLQTRLVREASKYQAKLQRYEKPALNQYRAELENVPTSGSAMYARSCAFCHGASGRGDGAEATSLTIPPENLTEIRTTKPYLMKILRAGVPGTAMPYFGIHTTDKLESVMDYLNDRHQLFSQPSPVTVSIPDAARTRAAVIFGETCSMCHGDDGRGQTEVARRLVPQPPDFTQYTLQPNHAFSVITNGYLGTQMPTFRRLPADVRWGLVAVIQGFYKR